MLRQARKAMTLLPGRTRSCSRGNSDRSWISDPPGCSVKVRAVEVAGAPLHDLARAADDRRSHGTRRSLTPLNTGPRPSAAPSGPVNSSSDAAKRVASTAPLVTSSKAAGASVGGGRRGDPDWRFARHLRWRERLLGLCDDDRRREQTTLRDDRARQHRSGSHTHLAKHPSARDASAGHAWRGSPRRRSGSDVAGEAETGGRAGGRIVGACEHYAARSQRQAES